MNEREAFGRPVAHGLAQLERPLEALPRPRQVALGEENFAGAVEHQGFRVPVAHLDIPLASLLHQGKGLGQPPPVLLQVAQGEELCRDADGTAQAAGNLESLFIGLLRAVEVTDDLEARADVGQGHAHPPLVAGLLGECHRFPEQGDGFLRTADLQQRIALVDEGLGDDEALAGPPAFDHRGIGGAFLGGHVAHASGVSRLHEVDPRILSRGGRQLAQRSEGRDRLGAAAALHEALGQLQAVLDLVREEGRESPVGLARLLPVLFRLVETPLDGEPLLAGERLRQFESPAGFLYGPGVVSQRAPGLGQGGVDHRRSGVGFDGLLKLLERPRGIEIAQPGQPDDVEMRSLGARRPQGSRLLDLPGRELGEAEFVAQLPACARNHLEEVRRCADLDDGGHRVPSRRLENPQVDTDLATDGGVRADHDQVGAQGLVKPLELGAAQAAGVLEIERLEGLRHRLTADHAQASSGSELGGEHLGESRLEPARVIAGGEAFEVQHRDGGAQRQKPGMGLGCLAVRQEEAEQGHTHENQRRKRSPDSEGAADGPGRRGRGDRCRERQGRGFRQSGKSSRRLDLRRGDGRFRDGRGRHRGFGRWRFGHRRGLGQGKSDLRGGGSLDLPDLGAEPVPLAGHGDDVAVVVGLLAQTLAQGKNILGEVRLGDENPRPDLVQKLPLLHHLARPLDQGQQDRHGLRSDGDQLTPPKDAAADGIDAEDVELVDHPLFFFSARSHPRPAPVTSPSMPPKRARRYRRDSYRGPSGLPPVCPADENRQIFAILTQNLRICTGPPRGGPGSAAAFILGKKHSKLALQRYPFLTSPPDLRRAGENLVRVRLQAMGEDSAEIGTMRRYESSPTI